MEPILNEYILNHIFSYLKPHDLVHVSEGKKTSSYHQSTNF